ncbi:hypothetical protein SDC9_190386 [bioreactor metagenome]|uniref:Uncharacterized protein n=1 Tax=bioreactor metagenome TaxID=1076179 RepID=A0A645HUX8_9ZZZZ
MLSFQFIKFLLFFFFRLFNHFKEFLADFILILDNNIRTFILRFDIDILRCIGFFKIGIVHIIENFHIIQKFILFL